mgnify:FL=1
MSEAGYTADVLLEPGAKRLRVGAAGEINVVNGGKILDDGVQASAIAAEATADADATFGQPEADLVNSMKVKLNAALAALRGAGIIAP